MIFGGVPDPFGTNDAISAYWVSIHRPLLSPGAVSTVWKFIIILLTSVFSGTSITVDSVAVPPEFVHLPFHEIVWVKDFIKLKGSAESAPPELTKWSFPSSPTYTFTLLIFWIN